MIDRICPCCQETFTPNKYHPEQKFCSAPACRRASHAEANRNWRRKQRLEDPLRESQRKSRARRGERMRLCRELSLWRKLLAHQRMLLLGVVDLLGGSGAGGLAETISRCVELGRDLLRGSPEILGGIWENARPGYGFASEQRWDVVSATN